MEHHAGLSPWRINNYIRHTEHVKCRLTNFRGGRYNLALLAHHRLAEGQIYSEFAREEAMMVMVVEDPYFAEQQRTLYEDARSARERGYHDVVPFASIMDLTSTCDVHTAESARKSRM